MTIAELVRERTDAVKKATALESELFALGIQVAALKERLKLAEAVVDNARGWRSCGCDHPSCGLCRDDRAAGYALAAFDAVPGDVGVSVDELCADMEKSVDRAIAVADAVTRPRYASGEVPMVGDVVTNDSGNHAPVTGLDVHGDPILNGGVHYEAKYLFLVRRAAPPAPDLLARAVSLLREHAYDQRVIDFLADFDKGGV
jgi:hypothetical protein